MTKLEMLREIAKDCIADEYKAIHFSWMCREHKSVAEVEKLYAEWKSGEKDKLYFEIEIIGYTPAKKQAYLKRHNLI